MNGNQILHEIKENIEAVAAQESGLGVSLWKEFLRIHPADIAQFLSDINRDSLKLLFLKLPKELKLAVFEDFSDINKVYALSIMHEQDLIDALNSLTADTLTDLFDLLSDDELKRYLDLLHKKARQQVISLLKFHPESAGGIASSGSALETRRINSLSSGLPGTIARWSPKSAKAPSLTSSRRSAFRSAASGPWQAKQLADKMGRISRLKSTPAPAASRAAAQSKAKPASSAYDAPARQNTRQFITVVRLVYLLVNRPLNLDRSTFLYTCDRRVPQLFSGAEKQG